MRSAGPGGEHSAGALEHGRMATRDAAGDGVRRVGDAQRPGALEPRLAAEAERRDRGAIENKQRHRRSSPLIGCCEHRAAAQEAIGAAR
eukprot:3044869-Prymnesium_polylepis.1